MRSKVVNLITRGDTETYEVIREALILYDEYLHANKDIPKAIQVRAILGELNKQRNRRLI